MSLKREGFLDPSLFCMIFGEIVGFDCSFRMFSYVLTFIKMICLSFGDFYSIFYWFHHFICSFSNYNCTFVNFICRFSFFICTSPDLFAVLAILIALSPIFIADLIFLFTLTRLIIDPTYLIEATT